MWTLVETGDMAKLKGERGTKVYGFEKIRRNR